MTISDIILENLCDLIHNNTQHKPHIEEIFDYKCVVFNDWGSLWVEDGHIVIQYIHENPIKYPLTDPMVFETVITYLTKYQ